MQQVVNFFIDNFVKHLITSRFRVVLADEISYATDTWSHKRKSLAFFYSLCFYVSHTHPTQRTGNSIFTSEKVQLRAERMWFEDVAKEVHGIGTKNSRKTIEQLFCDSNVCAVVQDSAQLGKRKGNLHCPGIWCQLPMHTFSFWRKEPRSTKNVSHYATSRDGSSRWKLFSWLSHGMFEGSTIWIRKVPSRRSHFYSTSVKDASQPAVAIQV